MFTTPLCGCCITEVTDGMLAGYSLETLEYVHASVSLSHERRGDVELLLVCPSGTKSIVGATRELDKYARHCLLHALLLFIYFTSDDNDYYYYKTSMIKVS